MPTYTKIFLSGSTDGRPIEITATSGSGTTLHTATSATGTGDADEIYLWAGNYTTTPRDCTLQLGGTATTDAVTYTIPALGAGPLLIAPGLVVRNSVVVRATATVAASINVFGFVNRITG